MYLMTTWQAIDNNGAPYRNTLRSVTKSSRVVVPCTKYVLLLVLEND
jgi:hypothetical protein